jgi:tetratricopeptide (TPR) repeat protein
MNSDPMERRAAEDLAKELGYLPLALEQAAAYISARQTSFQDYLNSFHERGLDTLKAQGPVAGDYPHSILTTWALNLAEVEKTPATGELLRVSAFLGPEDIPLELITKGQSEFGPALSKALAKYREDPLVLDEVLEPLTRYSLILRNIPNRTYSLHRLVQAVIRDVMDVETQRNYAERTVRGVNQAFPEVEFEHWAECERLRPHALACAQLIKTYEMAFVEAARLLNQAGFYLYEDADYLEAEPLYKRALAIWENELGTEHPNVAACLNNLGLLHKAQGRYKEAEIEYQRSLKIRGNVLGPEHLDVAKVLNNLATLYYSQRRYGEAEPFYKRALEIREKALGLEHPDVAQSLNNLGALYYSQERFGEAETRYQLALDIWKKALGPEHPDVARSLNNLAELYRSQRRYEEAEPLFQRSLEIREKVLGPEHPAVATCLNNLAGLYRSQGQYEKSEPLLSRALAIFEKALGPEHPDVARVRKNYAALLRAMGREAQASEMDKGKGSEG